MPTEREWADINAACDRIAQRMGGRFVEREDNQMTDTPEAVALQARVQPWLMTCFGEMIDGDREERNHRFLEDALELVQSTGCSASEAHQLVDYVYGREVGEPSQEVGGVMITLAALCLANGLDMHDCGEKELARIWTKVEAIRAKQAAKPKHSPLPQHVEPRPTGNPYIDLDVGSITVPIGYVRKMVGCLRDSTEHMAAVFANKDLLTDRLSFIDAFAATMEENRDILARAQGYGG